MSQFQPKSPTHRTLLTLLSLAIGVLLALAMAVSDARGAEGTTNVTIDSVLSAIVSVESGGNPRHLEPW